MMIPQLESSKLIYKPLGLQHLSEKYVEWMNNPKVTKYLETGGNYTLEKLKDFLGEVEKRPQYFWAIHLKSNDNHIGNIKIDPINVRHGFGEYGIMMGDVEEWNKGYAREASINIIDYCFETLNLRKINLGVFEENEAAISLYLKLGFVLEGKLMHHALVEGKYLNVLRFALFNKKYNYQ